MKVLFVGDAWLGSNARSMAEGFRLNGHETVLVDTSILSRPVRLSPPWIYSKVKNQKFPRQICSVHDQIDLAVRIFKPDLLFCFKTIDLDQERLLDLDVKIKVHYSADDVSNDYNTSTGYLENETRWDLVVTTKRHNVAELAARNVKDVLFVLSAYDPAWHHPVARRRPDTFALGFIGTRRPDRSDMIYRLAVRYAGKMSVRGPGWRRQPGLLRTGVHLGGAAYGEELSIAVAEIGCNLVLLNSDNRDTHTCRTFEVPAAGGLFLGERTQEHQALLDEGSECFLFEDEHELIEHVERIVRSPQEGLRVAEAGYRRVVAGHHTYTDRVKQILATVGQE